MEQDGFGNLEDWSRVTEQLAELSRVGRLEEYQDAVAALLRHRGNWRLREAALESIPTIRHPTENLIREVCGVMMDEHLYYEARVLAAEALGAMLERCAEDAQTGALPLREEVREQMHALLNSREVPVIHQALRRILPKVE